MDTPPNLWRAGDLRAVNRCLTTEECARLDRELEQRRIDERASIRQALDAGVSPFRVYRDKILGCHSTGLRLQAVVLNLYNDGYWAKKAPVYLSSLIANADGEHFEILVTLLRAYKRNGENDREFLALGKLIAESRMPKPRRAKVAA